MKYKNFIVYIFMIFCNFIYACQSSQIIIPATIFLGEEELVSSLDKKTTDSLKRFGINVKKKSTLQMIEIKEAKFLENGEEKMWLAFVPPEIIESAKNIKAGILREWGVDEGWIAAKQGGAAYRFPSCLPKSLFIDEKGNKKEKIILPFTVGKDNYQVNLSVRNPEAIKAINTGFISSTTNKILSFLAIVVIFGGVVYYLTSKA